MGKSLRWAGRWRQRSLRHDAFYGLRLLVDVAVRALSPGINDPTTTVRALDEIEGVLRAAERSALLGSSTVGTPPGVLVVDRPSWEELADLALLEVLECGHAQVQVRRRLAALLDDLVTDVAPERQAVLTTYREQLRAEPPLLTERARAVARRGDRQGLGGSA